MAALVHTIAVVDQSGKVVNTVCIIYILSAKPYEILDTDTNMTFTE